MMKRILNSFFAGSVSNMVSFLSKKEGLSVDEVGKMMEIIEK